MTGIALLVHAGVVFQVFRANAGILVAGYNIVEIGFGGTADQHQAEQEKRYKAPYGRILLQQFRVIALKFQAK
jgi:hypothetical protein